VIKVDREILRVVDQNGNVRSIIHSQVASVVAENKNAVATDRDGSEIRKDDTVKEHGGEGRQGKVIYIHRGILFIQNRELIENGGLFVTRSTNVATMAAKSGRAQASGPDLGALNPAIQPQGSNGSTMPPPRMMGRDKMIGKTVTITRGPYKTLLGIVKDSMNGEVRVELHTKNKQISVSREFVRVIDPITGQKVEFGGRFPDRGRAGNTSATPNYSAGGRTPGYGASSRGGGGSSYGQSGSRTPGPSWGGSKTPGYSGDGGRTAYGGGDGSRTAYGGDGSRTAYGGNDGSRSSYGGFNSGGRTPGGPSWGNSGTNPKTNLSAPTPSGYNAPTPGPYSAPTPSGYGSYSAPTPGGPAMDAPTPGNFSAPTPGVGYGGYGGGYGATPVAAATPGAWGGAPETPAPSGEDPQYDE
jgi:transcription elongation factor SPT5